MVGETYVSLSILIVSGIALHYLTKIAINVHKMLIDIHLFPRFRL